MADELKDILKTYDEMIYKTLGTRDVGACFFAQSEIFVDSIEAVEEPLYDYSPYNIIYYQDFTLRETGLLSGFNICKIDSYTFIKVITPFTRRRSYDFLLMRADECKAILTCLEARRINLFGNAIGFPVIGIDFSELKKLSIDFLLDENLRSFCRSRHIKLKRGLVFEGKPGNGKSLSLRWLKGEAYKAGINFRKFDNPNDFFESRGQFHRKNTKHIFVFEDFDALLRERTDTDDSPNIILASILNTLDGIDEIEDVVSIFTTNKIQLFDSAFLRPGRIDNVISFDPPDSSQIRLFFEAYIPDYKEHYKRIEKEILAMSDNASYAILKGICDDINIHEFSLQKKLDIDILLKISENKLKAANKGKDASDNTKYIL